MKLTKAERAVIRARELLATSGPWSVHDSLNVFCADGHTPTGVGGTMPGLRERCERNAEFIAHAREDVPYLLSALDEAEAENERLYEMLGWISRKTTEGEIFGAIEHLRWHLANPKNKECQHG